MAVTPVYNVKEGDLVIVQDEKRLGNNLKTYNPKEGDYLAIQKGDKFITDQAVVQNALRELGIDKIPERQSISLLQSYASDIDHAKFFSDKKDPESQTMAQRYLSCAIAKTHPMFPGDKEDVIIVPFDAMVQSLSTLIEENAYKLKIAKIEIELPKAIRITKEYIDRNEFNHALVARTRALNYANEAGTDISKDIAEINTWLIDQVTLQVNNAIAEGKPENAYAALIDLKSWAGLAPSDKQLLQKHHNEFLKCADKLIKQKDFDGARKQIQRATALAETLGISPNEKEIKRLGKIVYRESYNNILALVESVAVNGVYAQMRHLQQATDITKQFGIEDKPRLAKINEGILEYFVGNGEVILAERSESAVNEALGYFNDAKTFAADKNLQVASKIRTILSKEIGEQIKLAKDDSQNGFIKQAKEHFGLAQEMATYGKLNFDKSAAEKTITDGYKKEITRLTTYLKEYPSNGDPREFKDTLETLREYSTSSGIKLPEKDIAALDVKAEEVKVQHAASEYGRFMEGAKKFATEGNYTKFLSCIDAVRYHADIAKISVDENEIGMIKNTAQINEYRSKIIAAIQTGDPSKVEQMCATTKKELSEDVAGATIKDAYDKVIAKAVGYVPKEDTTPIDLDEAKRPQTMARIFGEKQSISRSHAERASKDKFYGVVYGESESFLKMLDTLRVNAGITEKTPEEVRITNDVALYNYRIAFLSGYVSGLSGDLASVEKAIPNMIKWLPYTGYKHDSEDISQRFRELAASHQTNAQ